MNDVVNSCVQDFTWTYVSHFSEYIAKNAIAGLYENLCLTFGGTARLFYKMTFILPSRQHYMKIPIFHALANSHYLSFLIIVILMCVKWYFMEILILHFPDG